MNDPVLILADEPTSSLDDMSAATAIKLIREVAADNAASLVVATHDARVKPHFPTVIEIGGGS
jgi:putative ABC transport system ATP-binding protein